MALTMAKPANAASASNAPQRAGPATRVQSGASQPDFQVPEVDGILGVGARAPDSDQDASWEGFGGDDGRGRRRRSAEAAGARAAAPQVFRPTTSSDIIFASQVVERSLGAAPTPPAAISQGVGTYDRAIQAVTGTLPTTYLGNRLDVFL